MKVDLHCHTNASDGVLTPIELISRARSNGVDLLAITDHDTVNGIESINQQDLGALHLISGIEFSCRWKNKELHLVGLNFDLNCEEFLHFVNNQRECRKQRAIEIGRKLEKLGYVDTYLDACKICQRKSPGRPHFAQVLVQRGIVANQTKAFKRFLGNGKPGHAKHEWPDISEIIDIIHHARGVAILAHPARYPISDRQMEQMIVDFSQLGGDAIEVISGRQHPHITKKLSKFATDHQLLASIGSDFHRPGQPWADLGCCAQLPSLCTPVWTPWIS